MATWLRGYVAAWLVAGGLVVSPSAARRVLPAPDESVGVRVGSRRHFQLNQQREVI